MKRRLLYGLTVLLLLLVTGLAWLLNSESGMRWSYRQALPYLPDSLTLTGLSGTLTGPLSAQTIRYQDQSQILNASQVRLSWNPWGLLKADFDVSELQIQALDIAILENTDLNDAGDQPISLPQITLPLGISLDNAIINSVDIKRGSDSYQLRQIRASASARADRLEIKQLDIDSEKLKLSLQGRLHPVADYAHDIKLRWQAVLPSGARVEGEGEVIGDLRSTRVSQSLQGAVQLQLALELQQLLSQPSWQSELEVVAIDSKLLDPRLPPLQGKLSLSASGDTTAARVSGRLNAESPEIGAFDADFRLSSLEGERKFEGVNIDALEINAQQGQFSASGQVDWAPELSWQAEISASRVNPASLLPEWPGDIAAQLSSRGGFEDGELVVTASISDLQGELRGYPVSLRSDLQWKNNGIDISRLEFSSGETRISAEGQVSETLDLRWSLDSSNLAELHPQAQGRLTASGELGGLRQSPTVKAVFSGQSLQLPDYEIARVDGDLSFDLLNPQRFKLELSGQSLRLQGYLLQSLDMVADPDRIRASLVAAEASVQLALDGSLENDHWRGKLVQADIQSRDYHNWSLLAPGAISLSENSLLSDRICLRSDRDGEICNRIEGQDESWKIDLDLQRIPLAMFGQWMPAELQLEGLAQASARLEYRPAQQLLGKIDLDLSPGIATYRLTDDYTERFVYRFGKLDLWLESSGIKAETTLQLVNEDRFEGSVTLPAADALAFDLESQALQASLRLDTRELGMVDAMIEEIDGMRGVVAVDVDITGNLANPRVKGNARLVDGALNIPKLKLELAQLDIQLRSDNYEKISFSGEALSTGGKLSLRGDTLLNADQGWPSNLQIEAASVDLAQLLEPWLPQDTRIEGRLHSSARLEFKAPDFLLGEIELSAPSGHLSYPLLEGELENWEYRDSSLSLILDQQGIRGRSEISIGAGNTLDGDLILPRANLLSLDREKQVFEASARLNFSELAIIEALVPDIGSLRGSLTLNLNADGTLAKPNLAANAEMIDAAVDVPILGLKLERINLRGATASDNQFKFQLDADSGDGNITIKGNSRLDAASGWPTRFSITGDEFEVARIPEATVRVSPDLVVEIQDRAIDIRGDLLVPYAKLQPKDITTATQVSSDSVIIDSSEKAQPRWQVTTRINLILGERVNFFGYGFEGRLGGRLLIEEAAGQLTRGTGEINVAQGRYRAYGQRLDIENGRLLFTGGPLTNPGLDIRAVREVGSVTAGIHATGRLLKPKLELFSIPAMGQTDTLSYLLLGRPLESASNEDGAMMAKAALALGLTGGDKLARSIGDRYGFDEMRIESGNSGDQASLVVGRYLSPRLYASYGIGLIESFNTFNLRYEISKQWQLKAESGESHGADLLYTFER